ncbi:MAG: hypothetical protein ABIH71_01335, partial [Candidatus Omnitrophota bacterium]
DMYLRISKIAETKYVNINISTFRISKDMKTPFNPDNKKPYKRFTKEAHRVSVKHGGRYFSKRWLGTFVIYGKYRYHVLRIRSAKSIQGHDRLGKIKVNKVILISVYLIYQVEKIFKRLLGTKRINPPPKKQIPRDILQ